MRSAKIVGISLLTLLAIGAVIATTASAFTKVEKIILKTAKGVVAKEAEVKATSTNMVLTDTAGKVECSEVVGTGTLITNEAKTDQVNLATVAWSGAETEKECKSTTSGGAAKVTIGHAPWKDLLGDTGGVHIKGTKPPEIIEEFPSTKEICTYYALAFVGKFKAGKAGAPEAITETLTADKLKKLPASPTTCPEAAELSGSFTLTSGGEALESEQ